MGSVAQLVEHRTFNPMVVGSSPTRPIEAGQRVTAARLTPGGRFSRVAADRSRSVATRDVGRTDVYGATKPSQVGWSGYAVTPAVPSIRPRRRRGYRMNARSRGSPTQTSGSVLASE
jgi:hypothetical protein